MPTTVYDMFASYICSTPVCFRKNKKVYQSATVYRLKKDKYSKYRQSEKLYSNKCEIAYELPEDIYIEEK